MKNTLNPYGALYRPGAEEAPGPRPEPGTYSTDNLGPNLKRALKAMGLTQQAAAEMIDTAPPVLCNWCTGQTLPTLPKMVRICDALGLEPNWLLAEHKVVKN